MSSGTKSSKPKKISRDNLVKAREALEKNSRRLQRSEVELFAAGIAHEFNNVLGAALGHAEWALDSKSPEDMAEALEIIIKACERAREITWSLKGLAQPREERFEASSVQKLFVDVVAWAEPFLKHENIRFVYENSLTQEELCLIDFDQIKEVLINLIKNAFDAVVLDKDAQVTLVLQKNGSHAEFLVVDSGQGVSAEFRDLIFQPFFTTKGSLSHVHRSTMGSTKPTGGMGLGLYMAKNTALEHGGDLTLGKNPAEFILKLPLL